ncbi:hypothetical protein DETS111669_32455 [Delftia tsuruhatensis]
MSTIFYAFAWLAFNAVAFGLAAAHLINSGAF